MCHMRGRCVSARRLAEMSDPGSFPSRRGGGCTAGDVCADADCVVRDYSGCRSTVPYGYVDVADGGGLEDIWDADMTVGCLCDEGYGGYDCSIRLCPEGDDPLTGTEAGSDPVQRNEVQLLECTATFGTFTLSFMGMTTPPIPHDASVSEFTAALSSLSTLKRGTEGGPKVSVQWMSSHDTVCAENGNDVQVEFLHNFGDLSLLIPDGSNLGHSSVSVVPIVTSQKLLVGTKESDPCSNRGTCDSRTGLCDCLNDFTTSDGYGGPGTRGDCGHREVGTTSSCPGEPACLGYGTCSGPPDFRCDCQGGRYGSDCALLSCPMGRSWFSVPGGGRAIGGGGGGGGGGRGGGGYESVSGSGSTVHGSAECSDAGICDPDTGTCSCADGYTGAACEYSSCPRGGGGTAPECGGNGVCLSMEALARGALNAMGDPSPRAYGSDPNDARAWDRDKMRGCRCSEGWGGYDCSLRTCPGGDDPQTQRQSNEVQRLTCKDGPDGAGRFRLKFRGEETVELRATDAASDLESALNALSTVERATVAYADPELYVGAPNLEADSLRLCRSSASGGGGGRRRGRPAARGRRVRISHRGRPSPRRRRGIDGQFRGRRRRICIGNREGYQGVRDVLGAGTLRWGDGALLVLFRLCLQRRAGKRRHEGGLRLQESDDVGEVRRYVREKGGALKPP